MSRLWKHNNLHDPQAKTDIKPVFVNSIKHRHNYHFFPLLSKKGIGARKRLHNVQAKLEEFSNYNENYQGGQVAFFFPFYKRIAIFL
jgi:hypothetical protein